MNRQHTAKKHIFFKWGKAVFGIVLVLLLMVPFIHASEIELGLHYGYRQLKDNHLSGIYGAGTIIRPQVRFVINTIFSVEVAYEDGYKKEGLVGLYKESSTLTLNGIEAAVVLRIEMRGIVPFVKGGIGCYGYKQDIDSEFVRQRVDHNTAAPFAGAGLDVAVLENLYLSGVVHYVQLKVKPFDIEVDLSGLKILFGLRYRLTI